MSGRDEVYIGTILLDPNRWAKPKKTASFRVSEWTGRFAGAGFDGMELWQFHAAGCEAGEVEKLAAAESPVSVFNIYPTMTAAERGELSDLAALAGRLGARAVKFNVGADPEKREEYLETLRAWREELPPGVRLLCECHPGTIIEEPVAARRFFDELGPEGWEVIVHPFSRFDSLGEWLKLFGSAVTHAHLQMRDDDRKILRFDRRPELARGAVGAMRSAGYRGSWTLEFAEGTGAPDESIEGLWRAALDDLAFLRELLT